MAIYGYTRVSTLNQAKEGVSLDIQERQLAGWAMMQGLTIDEIVAEPAISGSIPLSERPASRELLKRLQKGDTVVAIKLDRMFRSALDALQTVERFKEKGVSLVLLDLGGDVIGNGMAKMFLTITAAFAEAERDRIRERIQTSKRDAKARGRYLGGWLPFGFERTPQGDLKPIPAEQAILTRVASLKGEGRTYRDIQATITQEHGRKLSLATLSRILNEPG